MNFPGEASEETNRLKKQIRQQDFRLSHLQAEKQKDEAQLATIAQELRCLQQKYDAGESRIVQLETENTKIKEDRERQKLAHSNLEQAYQATKTQLQGKEKDKRLLDSDVERTLERRARLAEGDAEAAMEKCRSLEERLRSAQASDRFHDTARQKSGDAEATVTALQNEITALRASLHGQRQHPSTPSSSRTGAHSRRPRSSSVSGSSSSDAIQLRESLNEAIKEVEQLRARATKSEREALKASNEKLAHSKVSEATIADLKSKVADLNDEVSFQRDNLLKKLEDEVRTLQGESARASMLDVDLQVARSTSLQQEIDLKTVQHTITTWQETADQLRAELARVKEEGWKLNEQLIAAEETAKQLQRRNREVESAKKRISKLSKALRKMLISVTNDQAAGDETQSQSVLAIDETTFANITTSNDYEAELVDELDQLLGYVDEADGRMEFAKVERGIQESNALNERQEMSRIVQSRDVELVAVKVERDRCIVELEEWQGRLREVSAQKEEIEVRLQAAMLEMQAITSDNTSLQGQVESLRQELATVETELKRSVEESLGLFNTIKVLEDAHSESQRQLAEAEVEHGRTRAESDSLRNQIADLGGKLQALQSEIQSASTSREELVSQVYQLHAERETLASQCNEANQAISDLQRERQQGELHVARLALRIHHLEVHLQDQARSASQRQADLLEKSLDALQLEGKQWSGLVAELRQDVEERLLHQHAKERDWREETDRQLLRVAALEAEVTVAREELQERQAQIEILELDLQAGRTNQQLAEDALKRFVPTRESDVTVVEDTSSLDVSNEANEVRMQLDQTKDALDSSRRIQKARESDLAVALEEAEELKSELDRLDGQLSEAHRQKEDMAIAGQDLQARLSEAKNLNKELEANLTQLDSNLSSTMRQLAASQNTVGEMEMALQSLETDKIEHLRQYEAVSEELKEAQEGYLKLKGLMESRNAEYWEVKEELAEWQERFERSQNDVKIKDELEERLREATVEVQDAKALAEEYLAKCAALEDKAAVTHKEIEQSRSQYDSLEAELEQSRIQTAKLEQVEQQLGAASALIEQLEQDLAQKAQECEDADDKELALRKDNKKLGARVAALQARIDKLQLQSSAAKAIAPSQSSKAPIFQMKESGSAGSLGSAVMSPAAPSSASRKRRAPEDEEQAAQSQTHPAVTTRAIYAPKPATTTLVKEAGATTKPSSGTLPLAVQRNVVNKASFPPSEQMASWMPKSPKKGPSATLQDRTNLLQPRQAGATTQDSHFLTKLSRFRPPPSIHVEAAPIAPS